MLHASKHTSCYSPFGVALSGRAYSSDRYRHGVQGQERDDELKDEGNSINFTYRMHDPSLGRFFAVDPLVGEYPFYSPYTYSGNRVIDMIELEGLEPIRPEQATNMRQMSRPQLDNIISCPEYKASPAGNTPTGVMYSVSNHRDEGRQTNGKVVSPSSTTNISIIDVNGNIVRTLNFIQDPLNNTELNAYFTLMPGAAFRQVAFYKFAPVVVPSLKLQNGIPNPMPTATDGIGGKTIRP
jgi:RHS repeat-associated protein